MKHGGSGEDFWIVSASSMAACRSPGWSADTLKRSWPQKLPRLMQHAPY
jgi:hypothetical protein